MAGRKRARRAARRAEKEINAVAAEKEQEKLDIILLVV